MAVARKVEKTDNLPPPLVTKDQLTADFLHLVQDVAEIENDCLDLPNVAEDDEDLARITKAASGIIKLAKRIDEQKKEAKRPFLDANTLLESFFAHGLGATLAALKTDLEKVSTAYQRKKAAKEQAARDQAAAEAQAKAAAAQRQVEQTVQSGNVQAVAAAVTQSNALADFANRATAAAAAPTSSMGIVKTEAGTASLVDNWTFDQLDMDTVDLETLRPFIAQASIEQALRAFIKAGRRQIKGARIFNDNRSRFRG
ncbi:hypothetical protein [Bradyrhizobium sp. CCBAU 51753]|uniref:hypothetical protein n=1 Tax=Bradyrhizobium sp. CCBAU 51753 TaxID=1325100 RepID=UPI00188A345A|nr:hypothetical protein [Bradyrhizobium sp. CCBAU 51753]QOZ25329.1 hypothetical protein XH93_18310 [Bradyrhizobium sp. CCBAU 51753]